MLAKALVVTDLHKRWKDMESIRGVTKVQNEIQHDIAQFCIENNVTHIFIAGDWYDRGFHGIGQAYSCMEEDRMISDCVNGNVYLCIGNHFYLERDDNPEMYIIQPSSYMKPKDIIQVAKKPIFNVVPELRIGDVQISFFHYNKTNKIYRKHLTPDIKYHIGIYHDEICVPSWVREKEGFGGLTPVFTLEQLYSNVDLAIHGHIHTDIGQVNFQCTDGHTVPLVIPGSLGISQNKESIKHKEVNLPLIEISDDSKVTIEFVKFSTHLDELSFYKIERAQRSKKVVADRSIRPTGGNAPRNLMSFLQSNGMDERKLKLVNEAMHERLDLQTAIAIVAEIL